MTQTPPPRFHTPRAGRLGGLDGLRAIAVGLVLCYHLFPGSLPGGFLGVDVFFAISGFLITTLLLREHRSTGRIALWSFWKRRARRLLPALGLVLVISTALALLANRDLLVGIGRQIAGAALFVSNWTSIVGGADYFARDAPELFRNTWSLAIEEQYYIVLPLLLLVVVRIGNRYVRALPLAALGTASALLMAGLAAAGADPTRVYFGSDTHIFGLACGAALALATAPRSTPAPQETASALAHVVSAATAIAGLATLGWLAATLREGSAESFAWGFQLATLAALATVWAVSRPGVWIGRALDARPLRWIGERSYGIYLWHWPLLLIASAVLGTWPAQLVGAITLALSVAVAALSYRFVEEPVRRFGFRRTLARALRPGRIEPRGRLVPAVIGGVLVLAVPAAAAAVATAPSRSSAEDAVARGEAAREAQQEEPEASAEEPTSAPTQAGPLQPEGTEVTAIGDSVMLASLPELETRFSGITIDAAVSRGMGVGVEIAAQQADAETLRPVLLVGLGTNGPINVDELDALRAAAGDRQIVLVNAHGDREWIPGVNEALREYAESHRGVVVADWDETISAAPSTALAGDGIHPNPTGGELYADCVRRAIDDLQQPGEGVGFSVPRR
ncbi:acyltransferase family protein [Leucobacter sp. USCH14]|uniref:acyltransferase family protein n=1 Tax=Leucobacter sp. USCH14 TaxID=3024838 RepID=UPI003097DA16